MQKEVRTVDVPVEVRMSDDGKTVKVEGYAAVFDEVADIAGLFREVIRPGAFRSALKRGDDVVFLVDHTGLPLARTRSGTLSLSEDKKGLLMRSELDADDPDVARIIPKMKRGDLDKMSFAFRATEQRWSETAGDDELDLREVLDTELFDVSIVTTPAFEGTSIALRSRDETREEEQDEQKKKAEARAAYLKRKAEQEQKFRRL